MTKKPTLDFIYKKLKGDIKRKMTMKSIKIYDVDDQSEQGKTKSSGDSDDQFDEE